MDRDLKLVPSMDNVVVSLSAFAGSNVRIRWRLALDQWRAGAARVGWDRR